MKQPPSASPSSLSPSPCFPLQDQPPSDGDPLLPSGQLHNRPRHWPCRSAPASPASSPVSEPPGRRPSGLACVMFVGLVLLWSVHVLLEDQPMLLLHGLGSSLVQRDPVYRASWTAAPEPGSGLEHELLAPAHSNGTGHGWTVLLLHGLGDHRGSDAFALRDTLLAARPDLFGAMRFVIPFAPTLPISVFGGGPRSAWFDIASWADVHADEDEGHMQENVRALSSLIRRHALDPDRTIVGGFSQGAVMSLLLGLTLDHPPAALIMFSGYAPLPTRLPSLVPLRLPPAPPALHWLHGTADPFFPITLARTGFEDLKQLGYFKSHTFQPFEKVDHRWVVEEVAQAVRTIEDVLVAHHLALSGKTRP